MTQQELIACLHQYTPWEVLHIQNLSNLDDMDALNQTMISPVTDAEKAFGLHLPHTPDTAGATFSEHLFFPADSRQRLRIIQHDRYSPPRLHNHDFFELIYVYEGEFIQQIIDQKFLMRTGDFCLIPPDVYHALDVHNYSVVLNILISRSKFQEIALSELRESNLFSGLFLDHALSKNRKEYLIFHTDGDSVLRELVLSMCLEEWNHAPYYQHMMNSELLLLLGHLLRHYESTCEFSNPKSEKDNLNVQILQFIEQNYQTVTLSALAEQFHYSVQHMSHRIRQLTGMSFTEYLLQKRMQKASDLLIQTTLKVKTVSETIGYHNQEHFIRTFRNYYGQSPSKYRNLHQNADIGNKTGKRP